MMPVVSVIKIVPKEYTYNTLLYMVYKVVCSNMTRKYKKTFANENC